MRTAKISTDISPSEPDVSTWFSPLCSSSLAAVCCDVSLWSSGAANRRKKTFTTNEWCEIEFGELHSNSRALPHSKKQVITHDYSRKEKFSWIRIILPCTDHLRNAWNCHTVDQHKRQKKDWNLKDILYAESDIKPQVAKPLPPLD